MKRGKNGQKNEIVSLKESKIMPELVIRMILKAMEYIPDSREDRRRNKAKKRNK